MVRRTIAKVAAALKRPVEEKKLINRRLLLVVQFHGSTYVLQGESPIHQKNHCFKTEAENVFKKAFRFVMKQDTVVGKTFQKDLTEWHPIIFPLILYQMNDTVLSIEGTDLTGLLITKLEAHPLYEQLSLDKRLI